MTPPRVIGAPHLDPAIENPTGVNTPTHDPPTTHLDVVDEWEVEFEELKEVSFVGGQRGAGEQLEQVPKVVAAVEADPLHLVHQHQPRSDHHLAEVLHVHTLIDDCRVVALVVAVAVGEGGDVVCGLVLVSVLSVVRSMAVVSERALSLETI